MQFYLLLALSGVISGSTVLAQQTPPNVVTGYHAPGCTGPDTFTYTATTSMTCTPVADPGSRSVNVPPGVRCAFYAGPGCSGAPQLVGAPACVAITLPTLQSFVCIQYQGNVN